MLKIKHLLLLLLIWPFHVSSVRAQLAPAAMDSLVERALKTFHVPGIAVGIVKDGKLIFAKGYGLRSLGSRQKMDENTLVGIASNTKAFTVAAIGILCDEGKLNLDDKVTDYIPEFKMYDPYVTAEFTIRDLLTHRSGLGLGAGDLMIFPDSADFTVKDIIHNLRYLKPVSGFRSRYDYDNQLYIVAGELIARVSGMPWEDFIEKRILQPLQMDKSAASYRRLKNRQDVADAHALVNGQVTVIPRYASEPCNAAGGIYANITDLSKWVILQLNNGKYGHDQQLFSQQIHREMWTPQTIIPVGENTPYNTHFSAYGLGWFLSDAHGFKQVSHTGGVDGMVTKIELIPEKQLGIIILTNQQSSAAFTAIDDQIKDSYFGITGRDWVKTFAEALHSNNNYADSITTKVWQQVKNQQQNRQSREDSSYTGTYHDNWLGDIYIGNKNGQLRFTAKRSKKLSAQMLFYKANTFVVKWDIRSMSADAFLTFTTDEDGKPTGFTMRPISPETDFSYDFQDLDFHRVE
jgi:CubicO group peptidase (beta-lactamase class C family)